MKKLLEEMIREFFNSRPGMTAYIDPPEPDKRPDRYIVVGKTGGSSGTRGPYTVTLQSYGPTRYDAASLNELVCLAIPDIIYEQDISGVRYVSDYDFTNPQTKEYRYQAVFNFYYRR